MPRETHTAYASPEQIQDDICKTFADHLDPQVYRMICERIERIIVRAFDERSHQAGSQSG